MELMDAFPDACYAPQVLAAAARIDRAAEQVRARARLLEGATAACRWDGVGARAFRHRAHETTSRLRLAVGDLEDAAAMLRRHANRVADDVAREAAVRAAELDRARGELLDVVAGIGELVGRSR